MMGPLLVFFALLCILVFWDDIAAHFRKARRIRHILREDDNGL